MASFQIRTGREVTAQTLSDILKRELEPELKVITGNNSVEVHKSPSSQIIAELRGNAGNQCVVAGKKSPSVGM